MNAMIAAFEQAIAKKPNGIVCVGFEDTLGPIIDKAIEAGIPVVTVDGDVPNSKRIAFVGTGNYNAGYQGGQYLADAIGGKGKVAIMTKPGQGNLEERINGYKAALANYPDVEIVQIADTQSDSVVAAQAAATLLQKYPDLAGIAEDRGGERPAVIDEEALPASALVEIGHAELPRMNCAIERSARANPRKRRPLRRGDFMPTGAGGLAAAAAE